MYNSGFIPNIAAATTYPCPNGNLVSNIFSFNKSNVTFLQVGVPSSFLIPSKS